MRHPLLSTLFLGFLLLAGCLGITQPEDEDIKDMATQYFNQEYPGLFSVIEARKDNGYKQNDTHYVAEMTMRVKADRTLQEYTELIMMDQSLSALEKISRTVNLGLLKMTVPDFVPGDKLEFKRDYLFIKTDNGWLLKKQLIPDNQSESI
ncbi:hypothetical protein [Thiomicrorhabdus sp.]|jgi:hypothetical protein|uniref:hypothetical protein n=1 Tax=Thiomicrorhabdus sp. TaxID=2039724 RepID=UPI003564AB92